MDCFWGVRKRDDNQIFGLNKWKNGVVIYLKGKIKGQQLVNRWYGILGFQFWIFLNLRFLYYKEVEMLSKLKDI